MNLEQLCPDQVSKPIPPERKSEALVICLVVFTEAFIRLLFYSIAG